MNAATAQMVTLTGQGSETDYTGIIINFKVQKITVH